jgi:hypothetical protein
VPEPLLKVEWQLPPGSGLPQVPRSARSLRYCEQ